MHAYDYYLCPKCRNGSLLWSAELGTYVCTGCGGRVHSGTYDKVLEKRENNLDRENFRWGWSLVTRTSLEAQARRRCSDGKRT